MIGRPPALAERFLAWALGSSDEARAVLGDVAEEFVSRERSDGTPAAKRWYWRESATLAARALFGRALGRPIVGGSRGTVVEGSRGTAWVQDGKYAARAVRRDPRFFAFASLVIGIGVGSSTAVFSVMSPLLIRPLPFAEPGQLVLIENGSSGPGLSGITSRTSNLRDFRAMARSFDGIAGFNAFYDQQSFNLGGDDPARLVGVGVTANFLEVLGVSPEVGRGFTEEEGRWGGFVDRDAGPRAVILTREFWVRRFGADPSIVGRTITLDDQPVSVVGVLPRSFDFYSVFAPTNPVDFLLPWPVSEATDNTGNTTTMVARLRPDVSMESAQADLDAVVEGLQDAEPDRWGLNARVSGLQARIARPFRSSMLLLSAAATLLMLIVCVNLSNMLLARSPRRRREMSVRRALGATRPRLIRQLIFESLIVSGVGALFGVLLAILATRFVSSQSSLDIPMLSQVSVDGWAVVFTVAVALLAGLTVGAVPALRVSEGSGAGAVSGSVRVSGGRHARRFRELLVVSEIALAGVLLIAGGLVVRSFQRVMDVEMGFETENAIAWQLGSSRDFDTLAEAYGVYDEIATKVEGIPGVEHVGLVDALPLGTNRTWGTRVVGKQYEGDEGESYFPHIVDDRYLPAMEIPLIEGRYFTSDDTGDSSPVVIVSERAARTMFSGAPALGQFLMVRDGEAEVVGVVGDVKHRTLELGSDSEVYFPMAQMWDFSTVDMVVRTSLPPEAITSAVREAVWTVEAQMPTEDYRTLDSIVERSVSPRRFTLQILVAFALIALLLAAIGIYGVLSYSVSERIPEIGIRMALGQSSEGVRRSIVGQTLVLAAVGAAIGFVVSVAGSRLLVSLLFGIEPTDPLTIGGTILVLLAVALASSLLPAVRASRIDSAVALRSSV